MRRRSKWETLRSKLPSAWSIEETGLDPSSDAEKNIAELLGRLAMDISSSAQAQQQQQQQQQEQAKQNDQEQQDNTPEALKDAAKQQQQKQDYHQQEQALLPPSIRARNRWRSLKHTVVFANHMAALRSNDLLQEEDAASCGDAGRAGAAAFEGSKTAPPAVKLKGRRGMNGLIVRQDRGYISYLQDFYVAFLKLSFVRFFIGVFLAPVALALLFTPVYLFDINGLKSNDQPLCSESARWSCLDVLLYALSLSTTFGGSPIAALSPFCLLVANVHTLMAQFLFVFLSGAVFARMSQPAHPIRCSKKALIKDNDFVADQSEEETKSKVFVVRMVLTGPPPCELVDAKIRLTFRIFVRLLSGSMFCATHDLELVRSEVAYLRYGLTVRHVIGPKSPVYGHTMEALVEGDASFSLTILGMERSSMQPIFHLEDYFVCDGDVVWDGEYLDFVKMNDKGQRELDHSKIDMLKPFKVAGVVARAITRMEGDAARHKKTDGDAARNKKTDGDADDADEDNERKKQQHGRLRTSPTFTLRRMWKTMSNSTRTTCG